MVTFFDMVHTNGIGSNSLHERSVETALCRVDEWVVGNKLVGNACRWLDTFAKAIAIQCLEPYP
jgi:hypothetical protein